MLTWETVSSNYMYTLVQLMHDHTCTCTTKMIKRKTLSLIENWMFLICTLNFSALYPRVLYDKFGWNQPSGSWENELIKVSHVLSQKIPFSDQTELMVWGHDLITQYFSSQTCCYNMYPGTYLTNRQITWNDRHRDGSSDSNIRFEWD